jgi:hypothetical protein
MKYTGELNKVVFSHGRTKRGKIPLPFIPKICIPYFPIFEVISFFQGHTILANF